MTTSPLATSDAGRRPAPTAAWGRTALVVLVLATIAERALTLWHPDVPADGTFDYDVVAPMRETWWAFHFFGGVAVVMQSVSFVAAVCLLTRSRSVSWALAGATAYVLGAAAFGAGIAAEGVAFAYATDPAAISSPQGAQLLTFMGEQAGRYVVGILAGLVLVSLGTVALCIALLRTRAVPWIIPLVLLAGTVANVVLPFGFPAFLISTATITAPMVAIGWYAARMR
jgi:hypothetical protein